MTMFRAVLKVVLPLFLWFTSLTGFSQLIYWSDPGNGAIRYATVTSAGGITGTTQLVNGLNDPRDLEIDRAGGRIFYTASGTEDVLSINITTGAPVGTLITTGAMAGFSPIAYSANADLVYGAEMEHGVTQLEASSPGSYSGFDLGSWSNYKITGIAADDGMEYVYITAEGNPGIYYTGIGGGEPSFFANPPDAIPVLIAVDKTTGALYFTAQDVFDSNNTQIWSYTAADGTNKVADLPGADVTDIQVYSPFNTIYYIDNGALKSMTLTGTNIQSLGVNGVGGIGIDGDADIIPPTLVSINPVDNTINIPVNSSIWMIFSEEMQLSTATGGTADDRSIRIYRAADDGVEINIPRTSPYIEISGGGQMDINPGAFTQLDANTAYYIQVGSLMFTDLAGNPYAGISDKTTWNFTTMTGITLNTPTAAYCGAGSVVLPDIVVTESSTGNITTGTNSLFLGFTTSNSSFVPGVGSVTFTAGKDIANASVTVTANRVNVTLYVSTVAQIDEITISGLEIITTAPNASDDIVRSGGTVVIAGLKLNDIVASLTPQLALSAPTVSYPSSDNHYCEGSTVTGTVASVIGTNTQWYGDAALNNHLLTLDGKTSITAADLNVTLSSPATYSAYVTQTPGACESAPAQVDIIIDAAPTPTINGGTAETCVGESVTYTTQNSMTNYVWTVSAGGTVTGGGSSTSSSVTVTWNTGGAQSIMVNYNNANGCTAASPANRPIIVNDLPTIPALTGDATACEGTTDVVYSTLTGKTNYVWNVSGGGITTAGGTGTDHTVTVTWNTAGPQTVSVNYTDATGCAAANPSTKGVTVNARPDPDLNGSPAVCVGATGVVYTTDQTQSSYVWNVTGGTITAGGSATDHTATVTWPTAGARSVSVNYTDANGCTAVTPKTFPVQVAAATTTSFAGDDQEICGATAALVGTAPGTNETGQWTIINGTGGSFVNDASATSGFNGTAGSTYLLRWTISNAACPATQDDVSIKLTASPSTAVAGNTQDVCGTSATLAATAPTVGTGKWSIMNGIGGAITDDTNAASTFTGVAGNSYTLRWTTRNGVCPEKTNDVAINFFAAPTTSVAGSPQAVCAAAVTLDANAAATGLGEWTIEDGTGGALNQLHDAKTSFTGVAGTVYLLRWTISNGPCTPSSSTVSINIAAEPTIPTVGLDQQPCGTSTTLTGNTPTVGTGAWSVVNGAGGVLALASSPTSGFSGNPGVPYTLQWTITNPGCPSNAKTVGVIFIEPPTTARAGNDLSVCGTSTTLAGNTATSGTGTWSVINGTGGIFANASSPTSGFQGVAGTSYTLRWTVAKTGCTSPSSDDVTVQMNPIPGGVGVLSGLGSICPGITSSYQVGGITNAARYEWQLPTGFELISQTGATAEIKAASGSGGTLSVKGVNDCASSNAATLDVTILPAPPVTIRLPANAVVNDELAFSFASAASLKSPGWSFGDNSTSLNVRPTHTYTEPGDYEITIAVSDGIGCSGQDVQTLHVSPEAELSAHSIKNVVTANGDNQNAVLYIDRIDRFPDSEVIVLDRWGVEVFRRKHYANDWDFRKGEEYMPAGNYVCLVKYQGKIYSRSITVLKVK